ncbi:hypothetical protein [Thalassotalea sp. G2M2-11]|uniref:hypothetical protein n=1 Tax=Thalassotalea sp. G2M2-11 TaxID=2787627 RepID=UPI0019CFC5C7|nr:hypothetical protein [Thalassotalea sp. G2M2-11]
MKLINTLSIITVALLTATANAKTTDVFTTSITKLQPINTSELVKSVEIDLAKSIKQLNLTLVTTDSRLTLAKAKKSSVTKRMMAKALITAE